MASHYRHHIFMIKPTVPSPSCDVRHLKGSRVSCLPATRPACIRTWLCRQGEQLQRRCVQSCQSARWVLTKCLHGGTGVGGGEEGCRERREAPSPPFLVVPHSRWRESERCYRRVPSPRLRWCDGGCCKNNRWPTFSVRDISFSRTARPPRIEGRKKKETRRGTEQKEKGGGMGEKVWGGIKREKQARFQFDKADMKVGRREQTKGNREKFWR